MPNIEINLSEEDAEIIIEILDNYLSDLSMEITDTDSMDFREKLKSRRTSIQRVLKILREGTAKQK